MSSSNEIRRYINLIESIESANDIIPGELQKYNTLAKQLAEIQSFKGIIKYIEYPSKGVQLAAVSQNGNAIQYINNPTELVQLAAVKNCGWAIRFILAKGIVPSIVVQRAAVLENPVSALKYMIYYSIPISKMIQWTAAKQIKERNIVSHLDELDEDMLNSLDPDVQKYLQS